MCVLYITIVFNILMEVFFYKVYIIFGNYSRLRLLPFKKKKWKYAISTGKKCFKNRKNLKIAVVVYLTKTDGIVYK